MFLLFQFKKLNRNNTRRKSEICKCLKYIDKLVLVVVVVSIMFLLFQMFLKLPFVGGKNHVTNSLRCVHFPGLFRKPLTNFADLWNIGTIPFFLFNINALYCSTLFMRMEQ
jgi:hypothetical protein